MWFIYCQWSEWLLIVKLQSRVWLWKWCYDFLTSLPHFLEKRFAPHEHYKVLSFWLLSRSKNTKCTTLWWLTLFFRSFSTLKRMMIVLLEIQWYLYCLQTWHTFEMHYYLVSTISKAIKKMLHLWWNWYWILKVHKVFYITLRRILFFWKENGPKQDCEPIL